KPHLGASALPVEVTHGAALPGGSSSAITATASVKGGTTAMTVTNRHYDQSATLTLVAPGTKSVSQAAVLAADSPRAVNSASQPDRVKPAPLSVASLGAGRWQVELPPHSVATIQFS